MVTSAALVAIFLPLAPAALDAQGELPAPDSVHYVARDLIRQGTVFADTYFDNRTALSFYNRALKLESTNSELLWHISQAYVDIAEHLPAVSDEEKEAQLAMFEQALEFSEKSVTADTSNSMALTRRALARNRVSLFQGFWGTVGLYKKSRADLIKAIELDSLNDLAHFVLGMTHQHVAEKPWILRWPLGLAWASHAKALQHLEKAVMIRGDMIEYRLEFARALIEEEDYEQARTQLRVIPNLPTHDEDDDQFRREARELLESIKDES